MITLEEFNKIKVKYGKCSSWAIWKSEGDTPKSNIEELSVLDPAKNKKLLSELRPNVIFVGLNLSRGDIEEDFRNFHSNNPYATDFKIRYAFKKSPYWGGYMTDIIKGCVEKKSGKVEKYLRENREFERQNVKDFCQELNDIGANNPTLIAFGNATHGILKRNFKILKRKLNNQFKILIIDHYASSKWNKENYRDYVMSVNFKLVPHCHDWKTN